MNVNLSAKHLILYDGVCGLCDRLIQFVLPQDRRGVFLFAAIQSATGRRVLESHGWNPDVMETFYVISNFESDESVSLRKSDATLFVVDQLGWPWKLALVLRPLPRRLLDWGYDRIAKSRYIYFGRHDTCLMPGPAYQARFLDTGS